MSSDLFKTASKRCIYLLIISFVVTALLGCHYQVNLGDNDYSSSWVSKSSGEKIEIETNLNGDIRFNETETDILEFPASSDLYIEIEDNFLHFIIRAKRKGAEPVVMSYLLGGETLSREEVPEDLLQATWITFFRMTGINAEQRVARIVNLKGINAVVSEIAEIKSNSVSGRYIQTLVAGYELNSDTMFDVIEQANSLSSNSEKIRSLNSIFSGARMLSEEEMLDWLQAAKEVSSNSNLTRLLEDTLDNPRMYQYSDKVYAELLATSASISSNSNLGRFVRSFVDHADTPMLDSQTLYRNAIEHAGNKIGSSSNLRETYLFMLDKELDAETLRLLISKASTSIGSSSNLQEVLSACIEHRAFSSELLSTMRTAIGRVGSSSSREALQDKLLRVVESSFML